MLPEVAKQDTKPKQKFLLFILDDMVEYLGPDFLGPLYPQIVGQICNYTNSKYAAIRQASVYGIGMVAQHGGNAFAPLSQQCLLSLKTAIDFPIDAATKEKKSKATQFYHARDNAIAALGKILKHQSGCVPMNDLVPFWMSNLPLTHDMEEAHIANKFLAEAMLKGPQFILGNNAERLEKLVMILGEICWKKQCEPETLDMLSVVIANMSQDVNVAGTFKTLCETKLSEEHRGRITSVYMMCNEEVRQKVAGYLAAA